MCKVSRKTFDNERQALLGSSTGEKPSCERERMEGRYWDGEIDRWKDGRAGIHTVRDTRRAREIETKEKPYNKFLKIYSLTTYVYE